MSSWKELSKCFHFLKTFRTVISDQMSVFGRLLLQLQRHGAGILPASLVIRQTLFRSHEVPAALQPLWRVCYVQQKRWRKFLTYDMLIDTLLNQWSKLRTLSLFDGTFVGEPTRQSHRKYQMRYVTHIGIRWCCISSVRNELSIKQRLTLIKNNINWCVCVCVLFFFWLFYCTCGWSTVVAWHAAVLLCLLPTSCITRRSVQPQRSLAHGVAFVIRFVGRNRYDYFACSILTERRTSTSNWISTPAACATVSYKTGQHAACPGQLSGDFSPSSLIVGYCIQQLLVAHTTASARLFARLYIGPHGKMWNSWSCSDENTVWGLVLCCWRRANVLLAPRYAVSQLFMKQH